IYNTALSAEEIARHYNNDFSQDPTANLVLLQHFEEGMACNANDEAGCLTDDSPSGTNDGTLKQFSNLITWDNGTDGWISEVKKPAQRWVSGKYKTAGEFNGWDDYVEVADSNSLDITDAITVSAWVNSQYTGFAGSDWGYERKITLSSATTVANYQVKVELTTSNFDYSKAQANGEDLRFYQTDETSLDYWIEEWDATGTSTIWVEVATSGTDTIYMYYGNSSAGSWSNGDDTFVFFDDFSGSSLDTDKWSTAQYPTGSTVTVSDDILELSRPVTDSQIAVGSKTSFQNISMRTKVNPQPSTGYNKAQRWGLMSSATGRSNDLNIDIVGHGWVIPEGSTRYYERYDTVLTSTVTTNIIFDWQVYETNWLMGTQIKESYNDILENTFTTEIPNQSLYVHFANGDRYGNPMTACSLQVDWVLVNNYTATEPTTTVGTETSPGIYKAGAYGIGASTATAFASINDQTISSAISSGWNHITLTYNKDAGGTDEMKLYINGAQ
ncbi:MAG: DUF2341 domain-containing protein, partial [Candidatus Pacebacteria bacterium]|nr:DUF2341 domain-containing protein [Candidatus Paceibacterota bacterium]